jgi:hypothetical protein
VCEYARADGVFLLALSSQHRRSVMAATRETTSLIAFFAHPERAQHFVAELRQHGFTDDQIGVATPGGRHTHVEESAAAGALTGVVPGALAGAAATALLPGVGPLLGGGLLLAALEGGVAGAAVGGLVGGLIGWGLSEEQAQHAEGELLSGRTLVAVKGERLSEAMAILDRLQGSGSENTGPFDKPSLEPLDEQPAG